MDTKKLFLWHSDTLGGFTQNNKKGCHNMSCNPGASVRYRALIPVACFQHNFTLAYHKAGFSLQGSTSSPFNPWLSTKPPLLPKTISSAMLRPSPIALTKSSQVCCSLKETVRINNMLGWLRIFFSSV